MDGMESPSRRAVTRNKGRIMAAGVFVVGVAIIGSVVYVNVSRHESTSSALPQAAPVFRPPPEPLMVQPIVPPRPRPPIAGAVDDATKACTEWKSGDATLNLAQQDAANAVAMCDALTGQRTVVRAGSTAVSLDVPSVAIGFALALFLWGVLVGLGSMFRSAFRRAPAP